MRNQPLVNLRVGSIGPCVSGPAGTPQTFATLGFIESVKTRLGFRAKGRKILESADGYQLREIPAAPYMGFFEAEKEDIGLENDRFWNIKDESVG